MAGPEEGRALPSPEPPYPLQVEIPYEPFAGRLVTLCRPLLALPALAFLAGLQLVTGVLAFFAWVVILIIGRYPSAMWRFNVVYLGWQARILAYLWLLRDEYPPLGPGDYPVRVAMEGFATGEERPPERSSRWRALLRLPLALPHWVVLAVLGVGGLAALALQWLVILVAGRRPEGINDFLAGLLRWNVRLTGYTLLLRDEYPPYTGSHEAPAVRAGGELAALVVGLLALGGLTAAGVLGSRAPEPVRWEVAYADAVAGRPQAVLLSAEYDPAFAEGQVLIQLRGGGRDPAPEPIEVATGTRLVKFTWHIDNQSDATVRARDFRFKVRAVGSGFDAIEVRTAGRSDYRIRDGDAADVEAFFEIPEGLMVERLSFRPFVGVSTIEVSFLR